MKKKIVYAIAGAGFGNRSRMLAVLGELGRDRFDISIISQPQLQHQGAPWCRTYNLEPITYGQGGFSASSILKSNFSFPLKLMRNYRRCEQIFDQIKPDALIVDSDFHCLKPAMQRKLPVISVNSSIATMELFRYFRHSPFQMLFSHQVIERTDRWLQHRYADLVLCPVIEPVSVNCAKVRQISPIVRRQFSQTFSEPPPVEYDIAVMLGGSGIGVQDIDLSSFSGKAVVIGKPLNMKLPPGAKVLEYDPEPVSYLSRAKIVVVQGGFNSISEVIALRKPAVVVPIPNHAEQYVNALSAEKLGICRISWNGHVVDEIETIRARYDEYLEACRAVRIQCDGAAQAARLIADFCHG